MRTRARALCVHAPRSARQTGAEARTQRMLKPILKPSRRAPSDTPAVVRNVSFAQPLVHKVYEIKVHAQSRTNPHRACLRLAALACSFAGRIRLSILEFQRARDTRLAPEP